MRLNALRNETTPTAKKVSLRKPNDMSPIAIPLQSYLSIHSESVLAFHPALQAKAALHGADSAVMISQRWNPFHAFSLRGCILKNIALFQIGEQSFALDEQVVIELVEPTGFREANPTRFPFAGVAAIRDALVPVADLSTFLVGKKTLPKRTMWLVVRTGSNGKVALVIDGAAQWCLVGNNEFLAPDQSAREGKNWGPYSSHTLLGVYCSKGQEPIPILNIAALLSREELEWLEDIPDATSEISPDEVAARLGEEWRRVQRFFPRLVKALLATATARPAELNESFAQCRKTVAAQLPSTLEQAAPYLVRYLWSQKSTAQSPEFLQTLADYRACIVLSNGSDVDWTTEQLREAVVQLLG